MFEDLAQFYFKSAINKLKKNDLSSAIFDINQAICLSNKSNESKEVNGVNEVFEFYNLKALCLYQLGYFKDAKKLWNHALSIKPDSESIKRFLTHLKSDEFKKIYNEYKKALNLAEKEEYKEALKILSNNEIKESKIVSFISLTGLCQYAIGKKSKALTSFAQGLSIDRRNLLLIKYIKNISNLQKKSFIKKLFKINFN